MYVKSADPRELVDSLSSCLLHKRKKKQPHWTVAVGKREDEKEEEKGPLKKRPERNPLSLSFFHSVSICETEKKEEETWRCLKST